MEQRRTVCGDPSDTFEQYAAGLSRKDRLRPEPDSEKRQSQRQELLSELARLGVRGWPARSTLLTRRLPDGCKPCLQGRGSNLCLSTLCNRNCFFCFNPKPRRAGMSVHGRPAADAAAAAEILAEQRPGSVGLSGGEPLLDPELAISVAQELRRKLPHLRLELYTNGDLLTAPLIARLRAAGIEGLRINLAARDYDPAPVRLALEAGMPAEVEIPAIPEDERRVEKLLEQLDAMKAPHLILHELFASAQNLDALKRRGSQAKDEPAPESLSWAPVAGSEESALRLLAFALRRRLRVSVYFCSCGTQQWIAERALARAAQPQPEP